MSEYVGVFGLDYKRIREDIRIYFNELVDGELKWYPVEFLTGLLSETDPSKWDKDEYTLLSHRLDRVKAFAVAKRKKGICVPRSPEDASVPIRRSLLKRFSARITKEVNESLGKMNVIDPPAVPYKVDPMGPSHSPSNICFAQVVPCGPEGKRQVVLSPCDTGQASFPVELMLGRAILRVYHNSKNPYPAMPAEMVTAINTMQWVTDPYRRRKVAVTPHIADLMADEASDDLSDTHLGVAPFPCSQFVHDQEGTRWFIVTLVGVRMRVFLDLAFDGVFDDDYRNELAKWKRAVDNKGGVLWTFAMELSSLWGAIPPWDQRCALFRTTDDFLRAFHQKDSAYELFDSSDDRCVIRPGQNPPVFMIHKTDKLEIIRERTVGIKQYIEGMFQCMDAFKETEDLEQLDLTKASDQPSSSSSSLPSSSDQSSSSSSSSSAE